MPVKHETSTRFMDEMRIIPRGAWFIAPLAYVTAIVAAVFSVYHNKTGDAFFTWPVLVPMVILGGTVMACYVLMIGYISGDARRRGMNHLGWMLLAIVVPNALGIVLYFVLRKPRTLHCPECSAAVEPGFGFCPRCRCRLKAVCPQCQRGVNASDKFCPHCGGDLEARGNAASVPVSNQS